MSGVLGHALVPFHEVLSNEEALAELEPFGLVKEGIIMLSALPLIAIDDPALLGACVPRPTGVSADWPIDSIVRIERRSIYAGISISYRCVSSQFVFPMRMRANASGLMWTEEEEEEEEQDEEQVDMDYNTLPVKALKAMAKASGIEGYSSMKKSALVAALSGDDFETIASDEEIEKLFDAIETASADEEEEFE